MSEAASEQEAVLSHLRSPGISGPFRTNQRGCSCFWPADYAGERGRMPEVRPGELVPGLLQQPVSAVAGHRRAPRRELMCSHQHRKPSCSRSWSSSPCRSSRHSNRPQSGIRRPSEPVRLPDEHRDHSQPERRSVLTQRTGCSSSGSDAPGRRFRQLLPSGRVHHCRSDRRQRRS
jgi:hypothetical protein